MTNIYINEYSDINNYKDFDIEHDYTSNDYIIYNYKIDDYDYTTDEYIDYDSTTDDYTTDKYIDYDYTTDEYIDYTTDE